MADEKIPPTNLGSAGVPPAVSGASCPRFGEVTIHDRGHLPHWEKDSATLRYFDNRRYRLFAWCVMPNHVHAVARFFPGATLASVLHSWKSFYAKKANILVGSAGIFWQKEYYDHLVRDESEFEHAVQYVSDNPAKAGLCDWRWVWVHGRGRGQDAHTTAAGTAALRRI